MGNGCSCCKESDNVNESQGGNGEGEREPLLRSGGGGDAARVVASGQAVVTQPPKRGPQDDKDVSLPATPDTHPDVYAKVEILPSGTPNVDRKLQDMASHFGEYVDQVNELVLLHDRLRGSFPDVCPNSDLQEAMRHLAQQLGSHVSVNKSRSESIGDDTYHIATETGNNDQPPPQWDEDVQCALQDLNKALELGVRLTSNGERLIQTCESLVARETELRKEVMVAQSGVDGPLRNQAFVRSMKNLKAVPNKVRALRQVVANTFRELKDVTDFFGTDPLGTDRVLIDLSSNTPPTVYREAVEPEIPPEAQDTAAQMVVASWLQDRDKTPASTKPPPSEYLYQNGQYRPVATPVDDLDVSALLIRRDDTPPVPGMLSGDLPQVHVATETAPELAASTTQDVQVAEERLVQAADPGVTEQNFQEQMSADDDVMKYIVKQEEETTPVQEQRLEQPEDEQEQQASEDGEPHAVEEEEEEAVVVEVVATSSTSLAEDGQKSEEDKEERDNLEEDRSLEEQEQNVDDAVEQEVEQEVEGTSGDEKIVESQDAEQVESEGENDQQVEANEQAEKSVADDEQKVAADSQEEVSEETLEEQVEMQKAENENDQDKEEDDGDEAEETLQDSQATLEQSGEDDLNTAAGDSEAIEHQTHGDDEQQKEEEHQSNGGQQQQQQQKGNDEHRSDGDAKQQNGDHVREESDEEEDTKSKEDDMAYQTADSSGVSEETLDSSSPQHAGARAGGDSQSPGTADEDQVGSGVVTPPPTPDEEESHNENQPVGLQERPTSSEGIATLVKNVQPCDGSPNIQQVPTNYQDSTESAKHQATEEGHGGTQTLAEENHTKSLSKQQTHIRIWVDQESSDWHWGSPQPGRRTQGEKRVDVNVMMEAPESTLPTTEEQMVDITNENNSKSKAGTSESTEAGANSNEISNSIRGEKELESGETSL